MKTKLFDDNENFTPLGLKYGDEISKALRPIFEKARAEKISMRDMDYVAKAEVTDISLSFILGWDDKKKVSP